MLKENVAISYPKIIRIKDYRNVKKKKELSEKQINIFLNSNVVIEEKLDGKLSYFSYKYYVLMGEFLEVTHTLYYRNLPDNILFFDVFDLKKQMYISPEKKILKILDVGGIPVPIIFRGKVGSFKKLERLLYETESSFNSEINPKMLSYLSNRGIKVKKFKNNVEGLVIKIYKTDTKKLVATKIIRPEFENMISFVGRYNRYPYSNIVRFWQFDEYYGYLKKKILPYVNFKITKNTIKKFYERYAETWRKKRFYF